MKHFRGVPRVPGTASGEPYTHRSRGRSCSDSRSALPLRPTSQTAFHAPAVRSCVTVRHMAGRGGEFGKPPHLAVTTLPSGGALARPFESCVQPTL
jgi:hypothetical protein